MNSRIFYNCEKGLLRRVLFCYNGEMAEILKFPGGGANEVRSVKDVAQMTEGSRHNLINELLFQPASFTFQDWKSQIEALLALNSSEVNAQLFHTGFNVFGHPQMTSEFTRDLMLYMAKSSDFEIRQRLQKHLSQGQFNIPAEYMNEVRAAVEASGDSEVDGFTESFHQRVEGRLAA